MWLVDDRINGHTANREKAEAQGRLESVANNTAAILSLLRRYQALSQVHAASSKLQATLGMEPEIGSVRELSLDELTGAVRRSLKEWEDGRLPSVPNPQPEPQATPLAETAAPSPVAETVQETAPALEPAKTPQASIPEAAAVVAAEEAPVAVEPSTAEPQLQTRAVEAADKTPAGNDDAAGED